MFDDAAVTNIHYLVLLPTFALPKRRVFRMNYADDRRDRRARYGDDDGLRQDFVHRRALALRDVGWTVHALFHAQPRLDWTSVGDYAQLAELAGFPELGVLALYAFAWKVPWRCPEETACDSVPEDWTRIPEQDCGCGQGGCGDLRRAIPFAMDDRLTQKLRGYCPPPDRASAQQILRLWAQNESVEWNAQLEPCLAIWRDMPPVLQLLTIKLLYLTFPYLAAEAVLELHHTMRSHEATMARDYKSHWAYFVLIEAMLLGQRIKPARQRLLAPYVHIAVWDRLFHDDTFPKPCDLADSLDHVRQWLFESDEVSFPEIHYKLGPCLFVIGDSHVLSLAWQQTSTKHLLLPAVVTGLKAWHVQPGTHFFTHTCWRTILQRLGAAAGVWVSAGEIDCREGLGGALLEGYRQNVHHEHVVQTVEAYRRSVPDHYWLLPVPPHSFRSTGRPAGQRSRKETIRAWNRALQADPRLLDYFPDLVDAEGWLESRFYGDSTHMNAAFLPLVEECWLAKRRACEEES